MSKQTVVLEDGTRFSFDSDEASDFEKVELPDGIKLYCGESGWFSTGTLDQLEADAIDDIGYHATPQSAYDAAVKAKTNV